ncbi:hypothetical protein [Puia dinghuensis]|nr:hypothetical protein [Puia dinghuensis]
MIRTQEITMADTLIVGKRRGLPSLLRTRPAVASRTVHIPKSGLSE